MLRMDCISTRWRTEDVLRPHVRFMGVLYPNRRCLHCKLTDKVILGPKEQASRSKVPTFFHIHTYQIRLGLLQVSAN